MIRTSKKVAIYAALLGLGAALVACGDDDGGPVDGGRNDSGTRADGGPDADVEDDDAGPMDDGGPDGGPDAGPGNPRLRLAHLIPGAPPVHICLNATGVEAALLITQSGGAAAPVPYRGISSYVASLALPPIEHSVRVYDATDIEGTTCPAASATEPAPIFTETIDGADFVGGQFYTVAAVGLPGGTGTAAPHLLIIEDDLTEPEADMARVRLVHAIPNLPAAIDVCFDADGPLGKASAPVRLFENVSFEDATEYLSAAPTPAGSTFTVHVHNAAMGPCESPTAVGPIPVPFPVPPEPANFVETVEAGMVVSFFAAGRFDPTVVIVQPASGSCTTTAECQTANPTQPTAACNPIVMRCVDGLGPTVLPWQDDLDLP